MHCPLSTETCGLIGAREIGLLRPGAFIVNTARGDIVQKAPVFAALRSGHLGGAGLDVVEAEPLRTAEEAATPNLIVIECSLPRDHILAELDRLAENCDPGTKVPCATNPAIRSASTS